MNRTKNITVLFVFSFTFLFSNGLKAVEPAMRWFSGMGGSSDDYAQSVACDSFGNTFVVGYFRSAELKIGSFTLKHSYSGDAHFFIAKYDSLGNVLWAKTTAKDEFVLGNCVATDTEGNVIVGGHYSGYTATFGTTVFNNNNAYTYGKMFLTKYDKDGNVLWAKTPSNSYYSCSTIGVTTDKNNNIYLTGHFQDGLFTFANKTIANATPALQDVFVYKLSSDGTGIWGAMMGGTDHDLGNSIALDNKNSLFVSGYFRSSVMNAGSVLLSNSQAGNQEIFIAKYDTSGLLKWVKKAGGTENDISLGVVADTLGNAYLAGNYGSMSSTFGTINITKSYSTSCYYFAKYDTNGNVVWVKTTTEKQKNSSINGLYKDINGSIYATGFFQSATIPFGNNTLINSAPDNQEAFIVRFDSIGDAKWSKSFVGFGNDFGKSITGDSKGNIYTVGNFTGNYISSESTFVINNSNGYNDGFILKMLDQESAPKVYTSLDKNDSKQIKVYPNPFRDFVIIETGSVSDVITVQVFNQLGQKIEAVLTVQNNQLLINTSQFSKGLYYFKITKNNKAETKILVAD